MDAQTIICQNCQTPNPARNLYCLACGKPLMTTLQQQTAPTIQTVVDQPQNQPTPAPDIPPSPSIAPPAYPVSDPTAPTIPPYNFGQQPQQAPQPGYPPEGGYPPQGYPGQGFPQQEGQQPGYPPQGLPPQQPYYPPPPPPPPIPAAPSLERLGARIDSWADLAAGAAEKASEIDENFVNEINAREIPQVMIEKVEFAEGYAKKAYHVVRSPYGNIAVHLNPSGKDLSMGWSLYVHRAPNWLMLGILAAIAFGISFLTSLGSVYSFGVFFVSWIFGTFRWLLDVAILALIAGYVWKGNFWYFFMSAPGELAKDELSGLTMSVHHCLLAAAEKAGLDVEKIRAKNTFRAG
jgi:hypothetical protein